MKKNEARLKELENTVELLACMKAEPILYHKVMLLFQEYKKEHTVTAQLRKNPWEKEQFKKYDS